MQATISGLYYYPLKSGRGIEAERLAYDQFGPLNDRRWMLVDDNGRFVSQREQPAVAKLIARPGVEGALELSFDGEALTVPIASGNVREVTVWSDQLLAADAGDAAANWLSAKLGKSVRLVAQHSSSERLVNGSYAKAGEQTMFADGFPFLLIGEASLADLNSRLEQPLPMNRFRPNIVVTGCDAFAEDSWSEIRIGGQQFAVVKPCSRCAITTTDQDSGARPNSEPLRTLAKYRRQGKEVLFGQNLLARQSGGELALGMAVELL